MSDERRRFPRVRLDGSAAGRATIFADFRVLSLTEASAAVEMDLPLAQGSACDLTLQLGGTQVDVKGRVAGVEVTGSGYRISIDFESVDEQDRPALQSYLQAAGEGPA